MTSHVARLSNVAAAALTLLVATAEVGGSQSPIASPIAITNVTVIDTITGSARSDMTVLVNGDRIAEVAPAARVRVPENAERVDGRGKFLIPGLWDMHMHWYDAETLPLFVANGVTAARVMWGFPVHHQWRDEIGAGRQMGPRLVIGSSIIDGPSPVLGRMASVRTAEDARRAVAKAKADGADFVKVYQKLSREAYLAIADESKRLEIPFVGHLPTSITIADAARAGQRSLEHDATLRGSSSGESGVARALDIAFSDTPARQPTNADLRPFLRMAVDTFSPAQAVALAPELNRNKTYVCPTLTLFRAMWMVADEGFRKDARLKYLPAGLRERFQAFVDEPRTTDDVELWRQFYERHRESTRLMHEGGVPILAGTDGGEPYSFPAFGIHDELRLLVDAGLTPLEALQTATLNPARFFGRESELGTVAVGKLADLVLLAANPLTAIGNTTKINAVVASGRLYRRPDLDHLLAKVEAAANK